MGIVTLLVGHGCHPREYHCSSNDRCIKEEAGLFKYRSTVKVERENHQSIKRYLLVTTHGVNGLIWSAPVFVTVCRVLPEIFTSSLVWRMRLYVSQADRERIWCPVSSYIF
jgi:hypothetical protein